MKKNIFNLVVICLISIFVTTNTFACSCMISEDPLKSMEDSDLVFVWEVIDIEEINKIFTDFSYIENKVRLNVINNVKWADSNIVTVFTPKDSATCWFWFEEWKIYMVYSNYDEDNERFWVSLCSRTSQIEYAMEDIEIFKINLDNSSWSVIIEKDIKDDGKEVKSFNNKDLIKIIWVIFLWLIFLLFIFKITKKD